MILRTRLFMPADWLARPWWWWMLIQLCLLAVVIAAGTLLALWPEKRLLMQAQRQLTQTEAAIRLPGRPPGAMLLTPAEEGDEAARGSPTDPAGDGEVMLPADPASGATPPSMAEQEILQRQAQCRRFSEDPASLFLTGDAIPPGALRWQASPATPGVSAGGWAVSLTTDYAGFRQLLGVLAALPGCFGLQALTLEAMESQLAVSFTLAIPDEKEQSDDQDLTPADIR